MTKHGVRAGLACLVAALLLGLILFGAPTMLGWLEGDGDDGFHWSMRAPAE